MKKLLGMLAVMGLTTASTTTVISCGSVNLNPDKITNLKDIPFDEINNYVEDNKNVTEQNIVDAVKNINKITLDQLQKNTETSKVTSADFTIDTSTIIAGDLSAGVTVKIIASENSKILAGETDIQIDFNSILNLVTLGGEVNYQTSGPAISESEAKARWFEINKTALLSVNSEVTIDWFETTNFNAGNDQTPGSIDILANSTHNLQYINEVTVSIITVIRQTGTVDTSVGNNGKIEDGTISNGIRSITQLSNGTILASSGGMLKLTNRGAVDKVINSNNLIYSIIELSNGTILAGGGSSDVKGSIYKLTDEGKIETTTENGTLDGNIQSIIQLSNGTILAGTYTGSIYKLTDEGKIDTTAGNNGKIEDGTVDGPIYVFSQLSNETILAGTSDGSIYKLTDEGKIDTTAGNNGKIEEKTITGGTYAITELSNGTILAGSKNNSIYKLTDEGKIDTTAGNNGKIEDGTFDGGIKAITELSNGTILAGTYEGNSIFDGSIYKLVN